MLAHILLFFQRVSSAGCNGVNKKKDDRRTQTSITDLEHSAATVDTIAEYTAVLLAITEYLKESLVPKENLHQSLQILKLLSMLLAQAGPPLWDKLLQTVGDSLEELVTVSCSQLTLPLMDVILAAHRYEHKHNVSWENLVYRQSNAINKIRINTLLLLLFSTR